MYSNPLQAYDTVSRTTLSGREIEAAVLSKGAMKLKACQDNWHVDGREVQVGRSTRIQSAHLEYFAGGVGKSGQPTARGAAKGCASPQCVYRQTDF